MKKNIHIGLNIGITSVGWAVLNDDLTIMKHGVRLFSSLEHGKSKELLSAKRREARVQRRMLSRKKTLKRDFIKWCLANNLIELEYPDNLQENIDTTKDITEHKNLLIQVFTDKYIRLTKNDCKFIDYLPHNLGMRKRALKQKIPNNELIRILYWYLSNRGYYSKSALKDYGTVTLNEKWEKIAASECYPVNIQINYYNETRKTADNSEYSTGSYRGAVNRLISNEQYGYEVEEILMHQGWNDDITDEYMWFIRRGNSYEMGPGNIKTPSKYGVFHELNSDGTPKWKTVWEKNVGYCSIYKNKNLFRAPRRSLSAELFSLLNDLNNITIRGNLKLSVTDKRHIINNIASKYSDEIKCAKGVISYICSTYDISGSDVEMQLSGIRGVEKKTKHGEYKITPLKIAKILSHHNIVDEGFNIDYSYLNEAADIAHKNTIEDVRVPMLITVLNSGELAEKVAREDFTSTHQYSYKALETINEIMLNNPLNSDQVIHKGLIKTDCERNIVTEGGYLKVGWIDELFASPSLKRAIRQSIHVLNALIKKYKNTYNIKSVTIEMTREKNHADKIKKHKELVEYLAKQKALNTEIVKGIVSSGGRVSQKVINKLLLFYEQKELDAYTGEKIDIQRLINDPGYCAIDHILPYSKSMDNSKSNLVLTLSENNSNKGDKTPWEWIGMSSPEEFDTLQKMWKDWYLTPSSANKKVLTQKFKNLTSHADFNDKDTVLNFHARNLVDNRYITKEVLSAIRELKSHEMFKQLSVMAVNGQVTNYTKTLMNTICGKGSYLNYPPEFGPAFVPDKKKKDIMVKNMTWNGHHAQDAAVVAYIANTVGTDTSSLERKVSDPSYKIAPSVRQRTNTINSYMEGIDGFRRSLNANVQDVIFTYKKEFKSNGPLADETIKSSVMHKGELHEVQTYSNIRTIKKMMF